MFNHNELLDAGREKHQHLLEEATEWRKSHHAVAETAAQGRVESDRTTWVHKLLSLLSPDEKPDQKRHRRRKQPTY